MGRIKILKYIWILLLTFQLAIKLVDSAELPPQDVQEALQIAIDYFNISVNFADKIGAIEKYYELERDEGIFMPTRKRQPPKGMQKIFDELIDIEFYLKDWDGSDLDEKVEDKIVQKLKETQILLEKNFWPFSENFSISDPMALYMKATKKTQKNFLYVAEEFYRYLKIHIKAMNAYKKIEKYGVRLFNEKEGGFNILVNGLASKEALEEELEKIQEENGNENFPNFIATIMPDYEAMESTDEILALQDVQNGRNIDESTKKMLMEYVPKCNKNYHFIIEKLKSLKLLVDKIKDEFLEYFEYYKDRRDEIYELLYKLKRRFGYDPDDWTIFSKDSETSKDEL